MGAVLVDLNQQAQEILNIAEKHGVGTKLLLHYDV